MKKEQVAKLYPENTMSWLDNGIIRLGVNLGLGGAVTHLSGADGINLINSYDWGRQIQMSFYSGPNPYEPNGIKPHEEWAKLGWNPIQSGDVGGNRSQILEHRNDGKSIFVKALPMQWPHDGVAGDCTFDVEYRLEGTVVQGKSRLSNTREDQMQYHGRHQELPAVYTNGPWYKLVSYTGQRPFEGDELDVLVDMDDGKGWPWIYFHATENWAALVNEQNTGIGVYLPGAFELLGGFYGEKGTGDPNDAPTGYMTPLHREILDHNITYDYEYELIVGSLEEIRSHVYQKAGAEAGRKLPVWEFVRDRQHWVYEKTMDKGWPIEGGLRVQFGQEGAAMVSPQTFWRAVDAEKLILKASFDFISDQRMASDQLEISISLEPHPNQEEGKEQITIPVKVIADGVMRDYEVDISKHDGYRGSMHRVRVYLPNTGEQGLAHVQSIALMNK